MLVKQFPKRTNPFSQGALAILRMRILSLNPPSPVMLQIHFSLRIIPFTCENPLPVYLFDADVLHCVALQLFHLGVDNEAQSNVSVLVRLYEKKGS